MRLRLTMPLAVLLLGAGCQAAGGTETARRPAPTDAGPARSDVAAKPSDAGDSTLPRARVYLRDAFGATLPVQVEVATTPESRQKGLMYRRELAGGKGMLFVFPFDAVQSFWMKNTLIPLDMLFIDKDRRVVGIVAQAEPLTLSPRSVGKASRYVLEVPGGWCAEKGIRVGSQVDLEGVSGLEVH